MFCVTFQCFHIRVIIVFCCTIYPFGHGLSYTTFKYGEVKAAQKVNFKEDDELAIAFSITNTGDYSGDEVVQLYIKDVESEYLQPKQKLRKFKRVFIPKGESKTIEFKLNKEDFSFWNPEKREWDVEKGDFEILIGSSSELIEKVYRVTVKL